MWRNNENRRKTIGFIGESPEIIVFDTETTGFKRSQDRIIELAAIKYSINGGKLSQKDALHLYIKPPFKISEKITEITGITNEQLDACCTEEEVFEEIRDFFGDFPLIAAHSAKFDVSFMNELYKRNCNSNTESYKVLDTLEMARDLIPANQVENYKLQTLANIYGLDKGVQFHSAIDDAKVTAQLLQIFYNLYLEMDVPAGTLEPKIKNINFWQGYRGFSRIYVGTDIGSLYYDIRQKAWFPKDVNLDEINMDYIEEQCLKITDAQDIKEFASFKGSIAI